MDNSGPDDQFKPLWAARVRNVLAGGTVVWAWCLLCDRQVEIPAEVVALGRNLDDQVRRLKLRCRTCGHTGIVRVAPPGQRPA